MKTVTDYKAALKSQYEALASVYDVMAIMCRGSRNYGLDLPQDPFDTCAIVVPKFADLIYDEGLHGDDLIQFDAGVCDVKDIRCFIRDLIAQEPEQIELLFTDYILVKPQCQSSFDRLIRRRADIARYDEVAHLNNLIIFIESEACLLSEKMGEGDVSLATDHYLNVFRASLMTAKYVKGASYKAVLDSSKIRDLRMKDLPQDQLVPHANHLKDKAVAMMKEYESSHVHSPNERTRQFLETWLMAFMKIEIAGELAETADDPAAAPSGTEWEGREKRKSLFGRLIKKEDDILM